MYVLYTIGMAGGGGHLTCTQLVGMSIFFFVLETVYWANIDQLSGVDMIFGLSLLFILAGFIKRIVSCNLIFCILVIHLSQ